MSTEPDVVDDRERHWFVHREDGHEAHLEYRADPGRLVLVHTEVPDEIGGRGIAGRLVEAAVDRAERTGETIVTECAYARRWLDEHPGAAAGITVEPGEAAGS
jgi:uncharacterized protein